ncbi:hypothetical protein J3F84DRAFT_358547 [Trichoderma pleuroticola]
MSRVFLPHSPPPNPSLLQHSTALPLPGSDQIARADQEGKGRGRELINKRLGAIVQSSLYHNDGRTLPCLGGQSPWGDELCDGRSHNAQSETLLARADPPREEPWTDKQQRDDGRMLLYCDSLLRPRHCSILCQRIGLRRSVGQHQQRWPWKPNGRPRPENVSVDVGPRGFGSRIRMSSWLKPWGARRKMRVPQGGERDSWEQKPAMLVPGRSLRPFPRPEASAPSWPKQERKRPGLSPASKR